MTRDTSTRTWRWMQHELEGTAHLAHADWNERSAGHTACGLMFGRDAPIHQAAADDTQCGNCKRTSWGRVIPDTGGTK